MRSLSSKALQLSVSTLLFVCISYWFSSWFSMIVLLWSNSDYYEVWVYCLLWLTFFNVFFCYLENPISHLHGAIWSVWAKSLAVGFLANNCEELRVLLIILIFFCFSDTALSNRLCISSVSFSWSSEFFISSRYPTQYFLRSGLSAWSRSRIYWSAGLFPSGR